MRGTKNLSHLTDGGGPQWNNRETDVLKESCDAEGTGSFTWFVSEFGNVVRMCDRLYHPHPPKTIFEESCGAEEGTGSFTWEECPSFRRPCLHLLPPCILLPYTLLQHVLCCHPLALTNTMQLPSLVCTMQCAAMYLQNHLYVLICFS